MRRELLVLPPLPALRSSDDRSGVGGGKPSKTDSSLVRGDGGMIVTFGPTERLSLSRSEAGALLTETVGLCCDILALEMEIVGWRDGGEGDLAPSRCWFGLMSFEKMLGAMKPPQL